MTEAVRAGSKARSQCSAPETDVPIRAQGPLSLGLCSEACPPGLLFFLGKCQARAKPLFHVLNALCLKKRKTHLTTDKGLFSPCAPSSSWLRMFSVQGWCLGTPGATRGGVDWVAWGCEPPSSLCSHRRVQPGQVTHGAGYPQGPCVPQPTGIFCLTASLKGLSHQIGRFCARCENRQEGLPLVREAGGRPAL